MLLPQLSLSRLDSHRKRLKRRGNKQKLKLRDKRKLMPKRPLKLRKRLLVKRFWKKRGKQRQIDLQS